MTRKLPELDAKLVAKIEMAWAMPQKAWARRRLLVVRLIAQHELTVEKIMQVAEVSRQTVFTYRDTLLAGGVAALLTRKRAPGRRPAVCGAVAQEFIARLEAGKFRQTRDAQAWIKKRTRQQLSESGVRQLLRRLGGKPKGPAQVPGQEGPSEGGRVLGGVAAQLTAVVGTAPAQPGRIWVHNEHRYRLWACHRVWGRRGVRGPAPYATSDQWGDRHEALAVDGAHQVERLFPRQRPRSRALCIRHLSRIM